MARRLYSYNVTPRYTPGSPALVKRDIALMVAKQEQRAYEHALTGFMGDAEKSKAERLGLRGIAEERCEQRDRWLIHDLCTGENLEHLFPVKLEKLGFWRFSALADRHRKLVTECFPDAYERRWFQILLTPVVFVLPDLSFTVTTHGPYTIARYEPKLVEATP